MGFKLAQLFFFTLGAIALAGCPTVLSAYTPPTSPFATHYHDCCRPAFSWTHENLPNAKVYAPVETCQKDGLTPLSEIEMSSGKSSCDGGNQFVCSCQQPWVDTVDPSLAYGFGAYNVPIGDGGIISACYLVEFPEKDQNGKPMKVRKMILQNINVSGGITQGGWDMSLAGGGVGDYNRGCKAQWGSQFGQTFGGVATEQDCCKMPESLRSSCLFRFTVFGNNPPLAGTPQRVRCPVGIIDRSGSQRQDDASAPQYTGKTDKTGMPAPDKYKRNRAVCQNQDPLGVVSQVCGGSVGGSTGAGAGGSGAGVVGGGSDAGSVGQPNEPTDPGQSPPQGYGVPGAPNNPASIGGSPGPSFGAGFMPQFGSGSGAGVGGSGAGTGGDAGTGGGAGGGSVGIGGGSATGTGTGTGDGAGGVGSGGSGGGAGAGFMPQFGSGAGTDVGSNSKQPTPNKPGISPNQAPGSFGAPSPFGQQPAGPSGYEKTPGAPNGSKPGGGSQAQIPKDQFPKPGNDATSPFKGKGGVSADFSIDTNLGRRDGFCRHRRRSH